MYLPVRGVILPDGVRVFRVHILGSLRNPHPDLFLGLRQAVDARRESIWRKRKLLTQVSSKILDFTQEGTFRLFTNINTITTSAVRILVCEPDVAQGEEGKAQGRSVMCGINGYLSTQWIAKELCRKVCLFLPSAPEIYLQGIWSALHVLRHIRNLERH